MILVVTSFEFILQLWSDFCLDVVNADLREGVTDSGLRALASSGCGARLTSLILKGV